jgi:hypothetical protein
MTAWSSRRCGGNQNRSTSSGSEGGIGTSMTSYRIISARHGTAASTARALSASDASLVLVVRIPSSSRRRKLHSGFEPLEGTSPSRDDRNSKGSVSRFPTTLRFLRPPSARRLSRESEERACAADRRSPSWARRSRATSAPRRGLSPDREELRSVRDPSRGDTLSRRRR